MPQKGRSPVKKSPLSSSLLKAKPVQVKSPTRRKNPAQRKSPVSQKKSPTQKKSLVSQKKKKNNSAPIQFSRAEFIAALATAEKQNTYDDRLFALSRLGSYLHEQEMLMDDPKEIEKLHRVASSALRAALEKQEAQFAKEIRAIKIRL